MLKQIILACKPSFHLEPDNPAQIISGKVYSMVELSKVSNEYYRPHYDKINTHKIIEYFREDQYNDTEEQAGYTED